MKDFLAELVAYGILGLLTLLITRVARRKKEHTNKDE